LLTPGGGVQQQAWVSSAWADQRREESLHPRRSLKLNLNSDRNLQHRISISSRTIQGYTLQPIYQNGQIKGQIQVMDIVHRLHNSNRKAGYWFQSINR
jgi:hypothetical protein